MTFSGNRFLPILGLSCVFAFLGGCGSKKIPAPAVRAQPPDSSVQGSQSSSPANITASQEVTLTQLRDIAEVRAQLNQVMTDNGWQPNQVAVILDIDGTLTLYSEPTRAPGYMLSHIPPRPGAVELVQGLAADGFSLVFSSAWNVMEQTIEKLRFLGLENEADITSPTPIETGTFQQLHTDGRMATLHYMRKGKAVSLAIQSLPGSRGDGPNYVRKALAPLLSMTEVQRSQIRAVLFVDDNLSYIQRFREDMQNYRPFGVNHPTVIYAPLTPVDGAL